MRIPDAEAAPAPPAAAAVPESTPPRPAPMRQPTAEEREAIRREREWLVEAMKEKEAERAVLREEQKNQPFPLISDPRRPPGDMSASIIDMVIQRQGRPSDADTPATRSGEVGRDPSDPRGLSPALGTSAMETLPSQRYTPMSETGFSTTNRPAVAQDSAADIPNPIRDTTPVANRPTVATSGPAVTGAPAAQSPGAAGVPTLTVDTMRMMEQERGRAAEARPTVNQLRSRIPDPNDVRP